MAEAFCDPMLCLPQFTLGFCQRSDSCLDMESLSPNQQGAAEEKSSGAGAAEAQARSKPRASPFSSIGGEDARVRSRLAVAREEANVTAMRGETMTSVAPSRLNNFKHIMLM